MISNHPKIRLNEIAYTLKMSNEYIENIVHE